jgi:malate dehydrogenase
MAIIERNNTFGLFSNIKNKNNNKETTTKKKKKKKFTVAVLGAAGGIGQTLSLLLKQSEMIKSLRLYDIAPITPGIAVDLSHINTESEVLGFAGPEQLQRALEGCDLVIIPAGIPRKPGMTRDDLFKINAGIVRDLTIGVAKHCPNAIVNIISNPVNSTVPIAVEVLKKYYVFDPRKVLGVTKLDVMRAETFIHGLRKNELTDSIANIKVPVIGGHAGATIIPLLSQVTPKFTKPFEGEELIALTTRIQNAGTEVVDAKAGAGSATLSMALAAENMATSCLKAMAGEKNIIECAYVSSNLIPELSFFASKVKLGVHGVDEILELGAMTKFEQKMVQDAIPELKASIDKGVDFARKSM